MSRASDIQAAVQTALAEPHGHRHRAQNIDVSQLNLEVTKNKIKPSLNLTRQLSAAAARAARSRTGRRRFRISSTAATADALRGIGGFDLPTWNARASTSPTRSAWRRPRRRYARAELPLRPAADAAQGAGARRSAPQVTQAGLNVENTYKQFQARARRARRARRTPTPSRRGSTSACRPTSRSSPPSRT